MVRSMYSGVAGMRAHQQRLDVIGNNIANVNTYGFKSSRATFRDMYYQNIRSAAAGSSNRGGVNPSAIGYGSSIASVDLLMTQSSMTPTGNPLDVCITGEGFLQVMDNDGNVFYTKAGMLTVDPATGYLLDNNGYFVLGTQASNNRLDGQPGDSKIKFEIDPVEASVATSTKPINNKNFTISSANKVDTANVTFDFSVDNTMPGGQKVYAVINGNSISIKVNPNADFANLDEFNRLVNSAITEERGGVEHPGGDFTISCDPAITGWPLSGAQLVEADSGPTGGKIDLSAANKTAGYVINSIGSAFSGTQATDLGALSITKNADGTYNVKVGANYEAQNITLTELTASAGVEMKRTGGDANDKFVLRLPSSVVQANGDVTNPLPGDAATNLVTAPAAGGASPVSPMVPSDKQGLGSATFQLSGGTEGGPQSIMNLTGINIGADGVITASHGVHGTLTIGRIDLANFDNPSGLQQSGSSYYAATTNSGKVSYAAPGTDGTGALKNSALEMSNVDLSQEFSDMITTQRGFQANSRLITVSDTMLEELINLKR